MTSHALLKPAKLMLMAAGLAATTTTGLSTEALATEQTCPNGSFCAYPANDFQGTPYTLPARTAPLEECLPLASPAETTSFVNHTGKPVTTYQDPYCDEQAEFDTHPNGSQTPQSPYVVRAIKIWSH